MGINTLYPCKICLGYFKKHISVPKQNVVYPSRLHMTLQPKKCVVTLEFFENPETGSSLSHLNHDGRSKKPNLEPALEGSF